MLSEEEFIEGQKRHKKWLKYHKIKINNSAKKYYEENKEKVNKRIKLYNKNNKEKIKTRQQKYYFNNKNKIKSQQKEYKKSELGKLCQKELNYIRNHNFKFEPLNSIFPDSHGHHLDIKNVIFIPIELHYKYYGHCQKDNESMKNINIQAWSFMESQAY